MRAFYFYIMITGKRIIKLTPESVLQRISEYDIFVAFMPNRNWKLNEVIISPFPHNGKTEKNPSFIIGNRNGYLSFHDFSLGLHGDCFTFVKELYGLSSMDEILKLIDKEFGLGLSISPTKDYKRIIGEYKQPEELEKRYSVIQCITRKFTKEELQYWNEYHQDVSDLKREHIFSLEKVYLNRQLFPMKSTELRFGYLSGSSWKIYFPNKKKKGKWISNVPLTTTYGLEHLQKDKNGLILDSLKDYMVCFKVYDACSGVQNESLAAFSKETISYIKDNCKQVYWGGDSDEVGKQASYVITQAFDWKHINTPDNLLPTVKDWADMGRLLGLDAIKNHFITKGLFD